MRNEFVTLLLNTGWVKGHAPDGVRAERMKYRTEDDEWMYFHKPEIREAEILTRCRKCFGDGEIVIMVLGVKRKMLLCPVCGGTGEVNAD